MAKVINPKYPKGDPLRDMSDKLIWIECVLASDETAVMKLFLIVISRWFDANGCSSSMSYGQIQAECSISRRCARRARDRWLHIQINKGYRHPKGSSNLYHGLTPPSILEIVREKVLERRSRGAPGAPLETPAMAGDSIPTSARHAPLQDVVPSTIVEVGEDRGRGSTAKGRGSNWKNAFCDDPEPDGYDLGSMTVNGGVQ